MSERVTDEKLAEEQRSWHSELEQLGKYGYEPCVMPVDTACSLIDELVERRAEDVAQQRRITELEEKLRLNQEIVDRLKNAVPQIKAAASAAKLQIPGSDVQLALLVVNEVGGRVAARFTFEVLEDVAKLIGVEDVVQTGLVLPS